MIGYCFKATFKVTGKYLSEALILLSTNPQKDDRLFIELSTSSVHENYMLRTRAGSCVSSPFSSARQF